MRISSVDFNPTASSKLEHSTLTKFVREFLLAIMDSYLLKCLSHNTLTVTWWRFVRYSVPLSVAVDLFRGGGARNSSDNISILPATRRRVPRAARLLRLEEGLESNIIILWSILFKVFAIISLDWILYIILQRNALLGMGLIGCRNIFMLTGVVFQCSNFEIDFGGFNIFVLSEHWNCGIEYGIYQVSNVRILLCHRSYLK